MVTVVYVEAKHFGCMVVLNTKTGKLDMLSSFPGHVNL
jgi:hypothetical protein